MIGSRTARALACVAALSVSASSAPARAQPRTSFEVLVASVSRGGMDVDPALQSMARDFRRSGLAYSSFLLASRATLSLAPGQTEVVTLPNGLARVTLLRSDGRSILLRVAAPFSTSEYSMTPGGEIYIDAGAHGAIKNILAITYLSRPGPPSPVGYPEPPAAFPPPAPPYVAPAAPYAEPEPVDVDTFTEPLRPYGDWTVAGNWGRVWRPYPSVVGLDFAPYSSGGHWVWTEVGWTFESDWDWGWAPFHYGRWANAPELGWVWLPGTTWGPAWVDWRYGSGYVGWVPMGPAGYVSPEQHWSFVETSHFASPRFREFMVPRERVHTLLVVSPPLARPGRFHPSQPFGPPRLEVERAFGGPVPTVRAGSANVRFGVLPSHNLPPQYRGSAHPVGPVYAPPPPQLRQGPVAPPIHPSVPPPQIHPSAPPPAQKNSR